MAGYLVRRLALAVVVLVAIIVILVVLVQLVPGDPARVVLGNHATPQLIAQVRKDMGLNKPVVTQVWDFFWAAIHGSLGTDFISGAPVVSELGTPLVNTALLTLFSVLLALVCGIPTGVLSAIHPGGWTDRLVRVASMLLLSTPVYVVGLLLLLLFSVHFRVLPALGAGSLSDPAGYVERLIMPGLALSVYWMAYLARLVRSSTLEVLAREYVRTSRSYGVSEHVIRYHVALKNALVPVVALFGLMLGYVLAGTVYVETIFERVGLGNLAVSAVGSRDWPVVRGAVLIYCTAFIVGNLVADVLYRWLDPRMRLEAASEGFL
ncbi:MAG: ABC transporter permease [Acidimicrobiales bacterium]